MKNNIMNAKLGWILSQTYDNKLNLFWHGGLGWIFLRISSKDHTKRYRLPCRLFSMQLTKGEKVINLSAVSVNLRLSNSRCQKKKNKTSLVLHQDWWRRCYESKRVSQSALASINLRVRLRCIQGPPSCMHQSFTSRFMVSMWNVYLLYNQ